MTGLGRKVFNSGDILLASEVQGYLQDQAVMVFDDDAARGSAIGTANFSEGMASYLKDTDQVEVYNGSVWAALGQGKILQVVRATDTTNRSTSSTTFVDVTGLSVTITPQKSTSAILIFVNAVFQGSTNTSNTVQMRHQITDSSNNAISGAENVLIGIKNWTRTGEGEFQTKIFTIGYDIPGSISAITYKVRFRAEAGFGVVCNFRNAVTTGQIYAIEVAA